MDGDEKKKLRLSFGYLILGLWVVLLLQQVLAPTCVRTGCPYSEFKAAVAPGKVEEVAIGQTLIQGRMQAAASRSRRQRSSKPDRQAVAADSRRASRSKDRKNTRSKPSASTTRICSRTSPNTACKVNGVVESELLARRRWVGSIPIALIGVFWMLMIRRAGPGRAQRLHDHRAQQGQGLHGEGRQRPLHRRRRRRRGQGGAARR